MNPAVEAFCLALDVPDAQRAEAWVRQLHGHVGTFKIGLQLFCAEGPGVVARIRKAGARRIFLDLKLHDIPNTVASAVRALGELGVDLLTLHTAGGTEMMRAAVDAAGRTRLLGVTVLTSLDAAELAEVGDAVDVPTLVSRRAALAVRCGVGGLVCSAAEVGRLRGAFGATPYMVTPGVRLPEAALDDQRRVTTPRRARLEGADLLVVGRPVLSAADPLAMIEALQADWRGGENER